MPAPESRSLAPLDPWSNSTVAAFAAAAPVWGATKALLHAGRGKWAVDTDNDNKPRFVHAVAGAQMEGKFGYHVIMPPDADADTVEVAERELAEALLHDLGAYTARLHMMCAVSSATVEAGRAAALPRQMVYLALGLDRRTDLSRVQKDLRAFAEIKRLSKIGLSVMKLELGGKSLEYSQRISPLWFLGVERKGQVWQERHNDEQVEVSEDWSLLVRPGMWSDWFLWGARSLRQLAYMPRDLFATDARSRLAVGVGVLVLIRARIDPAPSVTLTPQEMLDFCGEDSNPRDRWGQRSLRDALLAAVAQQGEWGCQVDYSRWPRDLQPLIPQGEVEKVEGKEREPAPHGYWDSFLAAQVVFRLPAGVAAANHGAAIARRKHDGGRKRSGAGRPIDVHALRLRLGWTQRQLAEAIGVSDTAVRAYESGRKHPSAETARRLRQVAEAARQTEPNGSVTR